MASHLRRLLAAGLATTLAFGCGAMNGAFDDDDGEATRAADSKGEEGDKGDKPPRLDKLVRALEIARQKVTAAQLDVQSTQRKSEGELTEKQRELELAQAALGHFEKTTRPVKVGEAELALQAAKDDLQENREELEQLKLMYAEQDLADQTRDMVISRTERRLARSARALELKGAEVAGVVGQELEQERAKLALEVEGKQRALDQARTEARAAHLDKQIALMEAEAALADADAELKEAQEEEAKKAAKAAKAANAGTRDASEDPPK